MTDNEIVKALYSMYHATVYKDTITMSKETAIGLYEYFNRQKAEIKRLTAENKLLIENDISNKYPNCVLVEKGRIYTRTLEDYDELIGDISAEAYREFAERLDKEFSGVGTCNYGCVHHKTRNLLKELVGEDDG